MANQNNDSNTSNRGLASADEQTRQDVASKGGRADHPDGRGLQNADDETRQRVAREGGLARGDDQDSDMGDE
jgi:general stress protein YciG